MVVFFSSHFFSTKPRGSEGARSRCPNNHLLLGNMKARLVFVVEDLDRKDSRTFDIQEVQAFLQQLKDFPNLAFVLTGGLSSSRRIDFAKLSATTQCSSGTAG